MKIEKIKNFNQIILAIAGVLGVILLLVFLVMTIAELFGDLNRNTTITNSLISEEKVEQLNQENLRLQIVSYQSPQLIDTANVVYIIPVSVSTLSKPETVVEAVGGESLALLDVYGSMPQKGVSRENYFEGLFTNLIVYQPTINKTTVLFNERIMLSGLSTFKFEDDILLVFYTAERDSNKDGLINFKDDASLCVYSLKNKKMHRISDGANSITNYQFIENSKDLLVELSLNEYNDVKFKSYKPQKIMKYNLDTEKLTEVISPDIQQQMQRLTETVKNQ